MINWNIVKGDEGKQFERLKAEKQLVFPSTSVDDVDNLEEGSSFYNNGELHLKTSSGVKQIGGSTPQSRTLSLSAFTNPRNPTVEEADAYIQSEYGADATGFFAADAGIISPIETRELLNENDLYNAFVVYVKNPVTGSVYLFFERGKGHALQLISSFMKSRDGLNFSQPVDFYQRQTGREIFLGPSGARSSDGKVFSLQMKVEETPFIVDVFTSANDGDSFAIETTISLASAYAYAAYVPPVPLTETASGALLAPTYGLDGSGSNYKAGWLRTTNGFTSATHYTFTQTPATHKFNEVYFVRDGDTIYALLRSEGGGAIWYVAQSTNDGVSFSTPVACSFDVSVAPTLPVVTVLPDGRWLSIIRYNNAKQTAGIFISEDKGLNWKDKGKLYGENRPFMYSGQFVTGSVVSMAYSVEPDENAPYTGTKAGIYLTTLPAAPSFLVYRDGTTSSIQQVLNNPVSIMPSGKTFEGTANLIKGDKVKPVTIFTKDTPLSPSTGLRVGGDIEAGSGISVINGIPHTGARGTDYGEQGGSAVLFTNAEGATSNTAITGNYLAAGVANGYVYMGGVSIGTIAKYNPFTKSITTVTSDIGYIIESMIPFGKYMFAFPSNVAECRRIAPDNTTTTFSLPSSGWKFVKAGNFAYGCKASSSTTILKFDLRDGTYTTINIGYSFGGVPICTTAEWVYFAGFFDTYWLRLNLQTGTVESILKEFPGAFWSGQTNGETDGVNIWSCGIGTRNLNIYNPSTGKLSTPQLPSGTKVADLVYDGISMWVIPYEGALYKIDPKTFEYTLVAIAHTSPDGGATNKWGAAVRFGSKLILAPYGAGVVGELQIPELGKDLASAAYEAAAAVVAGEALPDGDYGDVAVSGTGTVMTIKDGAVTNAKIVSVDRTKVNGGGANHVPYFDTDGELTDGEELEYQVGYLQNKRPSGNAGLTLSSGTGQIVEISGEELEVQKFYIRMNNSNGIKSFGAPAAYSFKIADVTKVTIDATQMYLDYLGGGGARLLQKSGTFGAVTASDIDPAQVALKLTQTITTTGNAPTSIHTVPTGEGAGYLIECTFIAFNTTDGTVASFKNYITAKNIGGTATITAQTATLSEAEGTFAGTIPPSDVSVSNINIYVQGDTGKTIKWTLEYKIIQTTI